MIPQVLYLILVAMTLGATMVNHGKERLDTKHNFWLVLLNAIAVNGLLWRGGFFDVFVK